MDESREGSHGPLWAASERERIVRRRLGVGWSAHRTDTLPHWGLALSGGGIRSATFCLGVLQSLVGLRPPTAVESDATSAAPTPVPHTSLLARFDYLSTVSGGGFIGAFFVSLFVPGRLRGEVTRSTPADAAKPTALGRLKSALLDEAKRKWQPSPYTTPEVTAQEAYAVFTHDPPGRLRADTDAPADPASRGAQAMAWLRENGRYLTPTGAGDWLYAAAGAIRNWCALHYVIGSVLFTMFAGLAALRVALSFFWPAYHDYELDLLQRGLGWIDGSTEPFWVSPLWWLPLAVGYFWLLPFGVAFWLSYPNPRQTPNDPPKAFNAAALVEIAAVAAVLAASTWLIAHDRDSNWFSLYCALAILAIPSALAFVIHVVTATLADTVADQRVKLTRYLGFGLQTTMIVAALALVDTTSQTLYLAIPEWTLAQPVGLLAGLVWIVRKIAFLSDQQERPKWTARIPVAAVAAAAGIAVAFLVFVVWDLVILWAASGHTDPNVIFKLDVEEQLRITLGLFVLGLVLVVMAGRFPGFLNLSTLQFVYGERLTRAYLGASNGLRFSPDTDAAKRMRWRSVAEPVPEDALSYPEYYGRNVLAPIHIINVTVNQTTDSAEQLVQRDRKGLPLALMPSGFMIDGRHYELKDAAASAGKPGAAERSEVGIPLSIGQWVSVSGAAFSTGLGKQTTLGMSLLMGFANVRLGRWWPSGAAAATPEPWGVLRTFATQAYLYSELTAAFFGLRREWQYLSDGGHFENTGLYELLRPERKNRVIVVCDDGCDPDYRFGDLGNLVRMARIDFGLEIELDRAVAEPGNGAALSDVFGTPRQLAESSPRDDNKCALLYWVYGSAARSGTARTPSAALIILKPRLIRDAPSDLQEYGLAHPSFPQEPTIDQFFDEAQWESYRKLGAVVADEVFSASENGSGSLWRYLCTRLGVTAI